MDEHAPKISSLKLILCTRIEERHRPSSCVLFWWSQEIDMMITELVDRLNSGDGLRGSQLVLSIQHRNREFAWVCVCVCEKESNVQLDSDLLCVHLNKLVSIVIIVQSVGFSTPSIGPSDPPRLPNLFDWTKLCKLQCVCSQSSTIYVSISNVRSLACVCVYCTSTSYVALSLSLFILVNKKIHWVWCKSNRTVARYAAQIWDIHFEFR